MLEWAAKKVKRTWRGMGRRLRTWGYIALGGVALPFVGLALGKLSGLPKPEGLLAIGEVLKIPIAVLGLLGLVSLSWGWLVSWWRRNSDGATIRYSAEEGWIETQERSGSRRIRVDEVSGAHFVPEEDAGGMGTLVISEVGGSEAQISMSAAAARGFLRETELGPKHRGQRIESATSLLGMQAVGCLVFPLSVLVSIFLMVTPLALSGFFEWMGAARGWPVFVILASFLWLLCLIGVGTLDGMRGLQKLVVGQDTQLGTDGIRWGKWPFRKFLAYREIASIRVDRGIGLPLSDHKLVLESKGGEKHRIMLGGLQRGAAEVVEERLRGVLERSADVLMPQLARDERSDEEWKLALRRLIEHQGDYRRAAVPRERVREILQDPAAPPEQRLGAAVALVEAEDKEAHRILVSVSEATADPELREPLLELATEAEEFIQEEVEASVAH